MSDPTWQYIQKYLGDELVRLRNKNDNPNLNEIETAGIRARIAAVKDLLQLPEKLAAEAELSEPV